MDLTDGIGPSQEKLILIMLIHREWAWLVVEWVQNLCWPFKREIHVFRMNEYSGSGPEILEYFRDVALRCPRMRTENWIPFSIQSMLPHEDGCTQCVLGILEVNRKGRNSTYEYPS